MTTVRHLVAACRFTLVTEPKPPRLAIFSACGVEFKETKNKRGPAQHQDCVRRTLTSTQNGEEIHSNPLTDAAVTAKKVVDTDTYCRNEAVFELPQTYLYLDKFPDEAVRGCFHHCRGSGSALQLGQPPYHRKDLVAEHRGLGRSSSLQRFRTWVTYTTETAKYVRGIV